MARTLAYGPAECIGTARIDADGTLDIGGCKVDMTGCKWSRDGVDVYVRRVVESDRPEEIGAVFEIAVSHSDRLVMESELCGDPRSQRF